MEQAEVMTIFDWCFLSFWIGAMCGIGVMLLVEDKPKKTPKDSGE
jgi:hypothetical protein